MRSTAWTRGLLSAGFGVLALPTAAFTQGSTVGKAPAIANPPPPQDSAPHDDHHGLHFSHPIFTESISPDRKVRFDGAGGFADEENEWEAEFEGEWTFHRSFSIEVAVPYVFQDVDEGTSFNGFGNAEVAFKFANFAFEDAGVLLGYGMAIGVPTGDGSKGIGSDHIWELEPFLNAGYKEGPFEAVAWARFGIPTNQDDGEEIETDFNYDLSLLYAFNPRLQGLLELNGWTVASGEQAGIGTAFLGPGVKLAPFSALSSLFVGVGAAFPLDQDELDAGVRVSLFYHYQ